jgi:dimethylhistidine N-methyltransferase
LNITSFPQVEVKDDFASHIGDNLGGRFGNIAKKTNPKYLYDYEGSRLFEQICLQPEYYLTRVEIEILNKFSTEIASLFKDFNQIAMVELGSGSSTKTRILLQHFVNIRNAKQLYYFPVDLSNSILEEAINKLPNEFPSIEILAIHSDYIQGIRMVEEVIRNKDLGVKESFNKLVIFLGSSIGNFEPNEATVFLRQIHSLIRNKRSSKFLIGFDLHKNAEILEAAYNDRNGITAKFNLNILARINRELGGEFDLDTFYHSAVYNFTKRRVEMHLVSKVDQNIKINNLGKTVTFKKGESIHTENSYKYSIDQIRELAQNSGFNVEKNFIDNRGWFDLVLLSPN